MNRPVGLLKIIDLGTSNKVSFIYETTQLKSLSLTGVDTDTFMKKVYKFQDDPHMKIEKVDLSERCLFIEAVISRAQPRESNLLLPGPVVPGLFNSHPIDLIRDSLTLFSPSI